MLTEQRGRPSRAPCRLYIQARTFEMPISSVAKFQCGTRGGRQTYRPYASTPINRLFRHARAHVRFAPEATAVRFNPIPPSSCPRSVGRESSP